MKRLPFVAFSANQGPAIHNFSRALHSRVPPPALAAGHVFLEFVMFVL